MQILLEETNRILILLLVEKEGHSWAEKFKMKSGHFLKMSIASKVSKSKVKKSYPKHYVWKYQLITNCNIFPLILAYCKKAVLLLTFRAAVQKADKVNKCWAVGQWAAGRHE